jgi:hypothetical protein
MDFWIDEFEVSWIIVWIVGWIERSKSLFI